MDRGNGRNATRGDGVTVSPLLANIYLHYVFDLWAQHWRNRCASGDVVFVRYADDRPAPTRPVSMAWNRLSCAAGCVATTLAILLG
jgi:hypothetical protein